MLNLISGAENTTLQFFPRFLMAHGYIRLFGTGVGTKWLMQMALQSLVVLNKSFETFLASLLLLLLLAFCRVCCFTTVDVIAS